MIVTAILCLIMIGGVGYWSAQPHYVVLVNNLNPDQAADIKSRLDENDIANKLNTNATAVLVDQRKASQARMLIGNVVQPGQIADAGGNSWGFQDPGTRHARLARQLEARIAATITQFAQVEQARVHLGLPEPQPFIRQQQPKTASVVVQLQPGAEFSGQLTRSIAQLVSASVEGMKPEQVTISDTQGRTVSGESTTGSVVAGSQVEYRQHIEHMKSQKAEELLAFHLGPGKSLVRVSADIDFTQVKSTRKKHDPDGKVPKSEKITSSKGLLSVPVAGGDVGVVPNLQRTPAGNQKPRTVHENETSSLEYEIDSTEETVHQFGGDVTRLTIAAMVQLEPDESAADGGNANDAATTTVPATGLTKEEVEELIKNAVGFDESRGDRITVAVTNVAASDPIAELLAPPAAIDTYGPWVRNGSLGIAALVALVLGLLTLKRIRPITVAEPAASTITPQRARQISDLVAVARQHPELVSSVMSAWVKDPESAKGQTESEKQSDRRAA